ncbi:hypothetical protein [Aliihoeflea sp. 2WW]|uniref:hypothetical protein n=1 Tax=Aliihoeflea sp. 2WW TaxID=1381123 RepID=UPI001268B6D2|nr:hypothetical protein [Aliihoeflea sp. 2WW]
MSSSRELAGHNGSGMMIDHGRGEIVYLSPREGLAGLIEYGQVLFRGNITQDFFDGVAYVFKKGCHPAPYRVFGNWPHDSDKLILEGASPVRDGCEVIEHTRDASSARLVIDLPHH